MSFESKLTALEEALGVSNEQKCRVCSLTKQATAQGLTTEQLALSAVVGGFLVGREGGKLERGCCEPHRMQMMISIAAVDGMIKAMFEACTSDTSPIPTKGASDK
jgi:hypothetical protein